MELLLEQECTTEKQLETYKTQVYTIRVYTELRNLWRDHLPSYPLWRRSWKLAAVEQTLLI